MIQKDLNQENEEIKKKAYELYEKHGFKDGNDFVDWLEAEKQSIKTPKVKTSNQLKKVLITMLFLLCMIIAVLLITLFKKNPKMEFSNKNLSDLKVMMLVLDPKEDQDVLVFGDTHFDFNQSTLSTEAKLLLDEDVQKLQENPNVNVRMAGYTSAKGTEDVNQKISEDRANAVRSYLIEKGIAPERITSIGYGRTKPALYEVTPGDVNSKEAMANMRVLFEVIVK